ncbi:hypothetical protein MPH47_06245 [Psychrobacillus psychrodurans]|uniref:hypothetical protein n=1 Tax=Psychrobacillus psychrodurans TaxID=126157 RepID=UPI001F4DB1FA|nr:hypothetical protein [Psychrobacillus psychrodurans]MCK1996831.1 hypothetical protein [Psychrobacillus psychrodurans]
MPVENAIHSSDAPEESTYPVHILGDCTNTKCNEDIYTGDYVEYGGQFYCNEYCLGVHLISEGQAVDMRNGY